MPEDLGMGWPLTLRPKCGVRSPDRTRIAAVDSLEPRGFEERQTPRQARKLRRGRSLWAPDSGLRTGAFHSHVAPPASVCQRQALSPSARTAAPMRLLLGRVVERTLACATASSTPM